MIHVTEVNKYVTWKTQVEIVRIFLCNFRELCTKILVTGQQRRKNILLISHQWCTDSLLECTGGIEIIIAEGAQASYLGTPTGYSTTTFSLTTTWVTDIQLQTYILVSAILQKSELVH